MVVRELVRKIQETRKYLQEKKNLGNCWQN